MATTGAPMARCIAHKPYADPTWSDAQRTAWEAIQAVYRAKDLLYHAFAVGALPSAEPSHRAWLAWTEAEREYALLYPGEEVK